MERSSEPGGSRSAVSRAGDAVVPAIEAVGLCRRFGRVEALAGLSLSVREGEFFSLLGPSGCGKTTLLRLIAGLDVPDAGALRIYGRDVAAVPAHKRPVNTVFQSYALFPHLCVRDNVAFGLRMRKTPAAEIERRVSRALEMMEIADVATRRPSQLSGGQKQRVALARAVVNEPEVLLLDEPLGALDLRLRKQLQVELHQLQRRLGITFVYVTHDQEEALAMSDRIAVMNEGKIVQLGTAEELYERPRTRFVAQFLGACNVFSGTVTRKEKAGVLVDTPFGVLSVVTDACRAGDKITLGVRPEKIELVAAGSGDAGNCVPARIEDVIYSGAETQYVLRARHCRLRAVAMNTHAGDRSYESGKMVLCRIPDRALLILEDGVANEE